MDTQKTQNIFEQIKSPQCRAAAAWLHDGATAALNADVLAGLRFALSLIDSVEELHTRHKAVYRQMLRALGVLPSTERNHSSKGKGSDEPKKSNVKPRDPVVRLLQEEADARRLSNWHKKHMNKQNRRQKKAASRLHAMRPNKVTPEDDEPLTPEEERRCDIEHQAYLARLQLGDGADPSLVGPAETLMCGGFAQVREQDEACQVDRTELSPRAVIKRSFFDTRERFDFSFCISKKNIEVENVVLQQGGSTTVVSGDIEEFGPPKMGVTWNFLVHVAIMVSQLALPLHRLAKMLSSPAKRFTSAEMSRYYRFVAEHFFSIYMHLGRQLANAPVLCGDDTPQFGFGSVARPRKIARRAHSLVVLCESRAGATNLGTE